MIPDADQKDPVLKKPRVSVTTIMGGLRRENLINLLAENLVEKLEQVSLPETLTDTGKDSANYLSLVH